MKVLDRRVLVLNKLWTVVNVCSLQRAISLLFSEKAKIIDSFDQFATYTWEDWAKLRPKDGEDALRSTYEKFRIPEVILLMDYDKLPNRRVKFSRRMIYKRDNFVCQYCGKSLTGNESSIDHIIPRSQGGLTTWTNCVASCLKCNMKKDNKNLKESHMKLLRLPTKPKFNLFKADKITMPKSWDAFVSEMFWNIELVNDNVG